MAVHTCQIRCRELVEYAQGVIIYGARIPENNPRYINPLPLT